MRSGPEDSGDFPEPVRRYSRRSVQIRFTLNRSCKIMNLNKQELMETPPPNLPNPDRAAVPGQGMDRTAVAPARRRFLQATGLELWLRDLLVSAAASVLIITFLYQPVRVEGTSMLPRLEDQRPALHQQVCLPLLGHRARRRGGLPLPARPGEELHQARDRAARRPAAHRPRPGLAQRQAAARELCPGGVPRQPLHGGDGCSRGHATS